MHRHTRLFWVGNRIMALVSAFSYALLTNRTLLIPPNSFLFQFFCEPFPASSCVLHVCRGGQSHNGAHLGLLLLTTHQPHAHHPARLLPLPLLLRAIPRLLLDHPARRLQVSPHAMQAGCTVPHACNLGATLCLSMHRVCTSPPHRVFGSPHRNALLTCSPHMLSSHALLTCSPHMLSSHALLTCSPHMLSSHALLTCSPHMPPPSSHCPSLTCPPHMPSLHDFLLSLPITLATSCTPSHLPHPHPPPPAPYPRRCTGRRHAIEASSMDGMAMTSACTCHGTPRRTRGACSVRWSSRPWQQHASPRSTPITSSCRTFTWCPCCRYSSTPSFPIDESSPTFRGQYLLHPANYLWDRITRLYHGHLAHHSLTVGMQVTEEALLGVRGRSIGALVVSLNPTHGAKLRDRYMLGKPLDGSTVSVFSVSGEGEEKQDDLLQYELAVTEIDVLLVTDTSTFGYVAAGVAGVTPYTMKRGQVEAQRLALQRPPRLHARLVRALLREPEKRPLENIPQTRACHATGVGLTTNLPMLPLPSQHDALEGAQPAHPPASNDPLPAAAAASDSAGGMGAGSATAGQGEREGMAGVSSGKGSRVQGMQRMVVTLYYLDEEHA
ncbi:unnamed protein product [Closterium sp. NIES-64]|nr:unnamed protein product [Closterium sp. NIES-64]